MDKITVRDSNDSHIDQPSILNDLCGLIEDAPKFINCKDIDTTKYTCEDLKQFGGRKKFVDSIGQICKKSDHPDGMIAFYDKMHDCVCGKSLSTGVIVGIILGSIALVAIIIYIARSQHIKKIV
jgi:hypothetical protein